MFSPIDSKLFEAFTLILKENQRKKFKTFQNSITFSTSSTTSTLPNPSKTPPTTPTIIKLPLSSY
jgi:hypothetical protein